MVSKQKMLYWFTILVIVFFVIEFFWPIMYSPSAQPSPSPSPAPKQFNGQGVASARVTRLLGELYVSCNSTQSIAKGIQAIPGVTNAFSISELGTLVKVNESRVEEVVSTIQERFQEKCVGGVVVLRNAFLEIKDKIELRSLIALNESRTLYPRDVLDAFRATGSQSATGFVESSVKEGDSVQVAVFATLLGDKLVDRPLIEQIRGVTPTPTPTAIPTATPQPQELNESVLNESGLEANESIESSALSESIESLNQS